MILELLFKMLFFIIHMNIVAYYDVYLYQKLKPAICVNCFFTEGTGNVEGTTLCYATYEIGNIIFLVFKMQYKKSLHVIINHIYPRMCTNTAVCNNSQHNNFYAAHNRYFILNQKLTFFERRYSLWKTFVVIIII